MHFEHASGRLRRVFREPKYDVTHPASPQILLDADWIWAGRWRLSAAGAWTQLRFLSKWSATFKSHCFSFWKVAKYMSMNIATWPDQHDQTNWSDHLNQTTWPEPLTRPTDRPPDQSSWPDYLTWPPDLATWPDHLTWPPDLTTWSDHLARPPDLATWPDHLTWPPDLIGPPNRLTGEQVCDAYRTSIRIIRSAASARLRRSAVHSHDPARIDSLTAGAGAGGDGGRHLSRRAGREIRHSGGAVSVEVSGHIVVRAVGRTACDPRKHQATRRPWPSRHILEVGNTICFTFIYVLWTRDSWICCIFLKAFMPLWINALKSYRTRTECKSSSFKHVSSAYITWICLYLCVNVCTFMVNVLLMLGTSSI